MKFQEITQPLGMLLEHGASLEEINDFLAISEESETVEEAIDTLEIVEGIKKYSRNHPCTMERVWYHSPSPQ